MPLKKKVPAPRKVTKKVSPKKTGPTAAELAELEKSLVAIRDLRADSKMLNEHIKGHQEEVVSFMQKHKMTKHTFTKDGVSITANQQQTTTVSYDEDKLRRRLGAKMWGKVTTKFLDKKKLEAYVSSGDIPLAALADCTQEKTSAPFVKVTT